MPYLLQALDFYLHEPYRWWSPATRKDPAFQKPCMKYTNNTNPTEYDRQPRSGDRLPKSKRLEENGSPLVYVCSGAACQIPT